MLKKLAVTAVAALLAAIALSAKPSKNSGQESYSGYNRYLTVVYANGPNERDNGSADHAEAAGNAPAPHTPFKDPNWVLVIVGSVTCIVIGWQSFETRRAAKASMKSADTALLDIQARISSERPWIQVTVEGQRGSEKIFDVNIVNRGRTPAAIISKSSGYGIQGVVECLPKEPIYDRIEVFSDRKILLPNEPLTLQTITKKELGLSDPEQYKRFREIEVEAYAFGSVVYRDIVEIPGVPLYETRWCYGFYPWGEADEMLPLSSSVDGYTKHT
jgi:hypothetical protein